MDNKIKVYKIIGGPSALTVEQGDMVYEQIKRALESCSKVIIDFDGIESMITPFLNSAIGKLYGDYDGSELSQKLSIINQPEGTNRKINLVIQNAKAFYSNKDDYSRILNTIMGE